VGFQQTKYLKETLQGTNHYVQMTVFFNLHTFEDCSRQRRKDH